MSVKDNATGAGAGSYAGMSYEELLANPPTNVRRKQPLPAAKPQRKAVLAEVSPRMHAAVQAKPEALRMIAEDAHGNTVIERPYRRPREEAVIVPDRVGAVGGMKWGRSGFGPGLPSAPSWGGGSRGDELVKHQYDIFAVLREDDNV